MEIELEMVNKTLGRIADALEALTKHFEPEWKTEKEKEKEYRKLEDEWNKPPPINLENLESSYAGELEDSSPDPWAAL